MSTILDALRKLQRERAAQSPGKDLRGSITTETPHRGRGRGRQAGSAARLIALALVILGVGGAGYALYRGGWVSGLLARFSVDREAAEQAQAEAELAEVERMVAARDAAAALDEPAPPSEEATPGPASRPPLRTRVARGGNPPGLNAGESPASEPAPARAESPETIAERARLEAALVNARTAQEAQRRVELESAAQQAAANPPPTAPAIPRSPLVSQPSPPPPAPVPAVPPAAARPKPTAPVVAAAKPPPAEATPAARATPRRAAAPEPRSNAFPEVRVESIRWHPSAERRVASLQFEQQDVPEAHEGDIVAGVLIYRIDPGSVELRIGSAQRTVSPGP